MTRINKKISIIFLMCLFSLLFSSFVYADNCQYYFMDAHPWEMNGSGTLADPWQIYNCEAFSCINYSLGGNYTLANDIDCSNTTNWNSGEGFVRIGDSYDYYFYGSLDGAGYTVYDIYMNTDADTGSANEAQGSGTTVYNIGVFGYIEDAEIKNINFENTSITTTYYRNDNIGGLVGRVINSNLTNITVEGVVNASASRRNVGGVIGNIPEVGGSVIVENVSFSGSVYGPYQNSDGLDESYVGGIVGRIGDYVITGESTNDLTRIQNCESSGFITADEEFVGGIIGGAVDYTDEIYNADNTEIIDCSSNATIICDDSECQFTGGIIGNADYGTEGKIIDCSFSGHIEGYDYVGGIIGSGDSDVQINDSLFFGTISANQYVGGIAGSTGSIYNSYSGGEINGSIIGGITGSGTAIDCYSDSIIYSSSSYAGGISGIGAVNNSYFSGYINGSSGTIGGLSGFGQAYNSFSVGEVAGSAAKAGLVGNVSDASNIQNSYWYEDDIYTEPNYAWLNSSGSGNNSGVEVLYKEGYFKGNVYPDNEPMASWDFFNIWEERENDYPSLTLQDIGGSVTTAQNYTPYYEMDSCPGIISYLESQTIYKNGIKLTQDVSSSSICFNFNDDGEGIQKNVEIDCQGYTITGDGSSDGFDFIKTENITVRNCTINNTLRAFYLYLTENMLIKENTILGSTSDSYVINWGNSNNGKFVNNILDIENDNNNDGINMLYSNNNTFSGNTFKNLENISQQAIFVDDSHNNTFYDNNFIKTTLGIKLNNAVGTEIEQNNFDTQGLSEVMHLYLDPGSSNTILYNNSFWDNQSVEDDEGADWNNSITGNYWEDYDEESEGCSDGNTDGFCDTAYPIKGTAGSYDYMPIYTGGDGINTIEVSSCPGDIQNSESDTEYLVTADLTYDWPCFNMYDGGSGGPQNVVIDCQGHTITGNTSYQAFVVNSAYNITIKNCTIRNASSAITMENSDTVTIKDNDINNSNYGFYTIAWSNTNNSNFINNIVDLGFENQKNGIEMQNSYGNAFSGNEFRNLENYSYGALLLGTETGFCGNNIVENNDFIKTTTGIRLNNASGTSISNNRFNSDGLMNQVKQIYIESGSTNNYIYNNSLQQNMSVEDNEGVSWNNSITGNHWEEYDEESEGCNDETPTDGFCDTAYPIWGTGNAYDYMPIYVGSEYLINISVTKTLLNSEGVSVDDIVEFRIDINNTGEENLSINTILLDEYNTTFLEFENINCIHYLNQTNGTLGEIDVNLTACHGSIIEPGDNITLFVNFTALSSGTTTNYAMVEELDMEELGSDSEVVNIDVTSVENATVNKTLMNGPIIAGDTAVFKINITNTGNTNLDLLGLTDEFNDTILNFTGEISCNYFTYDNDTEGAWIDINITDCIGGSLNVGNSYILWINLTAINTGATSNWAYILNTTNYETAGIENEYDEDEEQVSVFEPSFCAGYPSSFAGSGTSGSPYQITNCIELQCMNTSLSSHYILTENINCSDSTNWDSGKGLKPVGSASNIFTGGLNGDRYNITNLFINRTTEDYIGLIGYYEPSSGMIENLGIVDSYVAGRSYVGTIAGYSKGDIGDSFVQGIVEGYQSFGAGYVGGMVGRLDNAAVRNSYTNIEIEALNSFVNYFGGITGEVYLGEISDSYSKGDFLGTADYIGGITGNNMASLINNSYSYVNINCNDYMGGIAGGNSGTSVISNCFSAGNISASSWRGALIGGNYGSVINLYWYNNSNNPAHGFFDENTMQTSNENCTAITNISYFKGDVYPNNNPMAGWDFFNTWEERTDDFPVLAWQGIGENISSEEEPEGTTGDFGDAPDSTNHFGDTAMTAYPKGGPLGVQANFPTVWDNETPPGPCHAKEWLWTYLGDNVSMENDADLTPDADIIPNLNVTADSPDNDNYDDGLHTPLNFTNCTMSNITVEITVDNAGMMSQPYNYSLNVWFDWNRDGDWGDKLTCFVPGDTDEWAVQNFSVLINPSVSKYSFNITTPDFMTYDPQPDNETWMRMTLAPEFDQFTNPFTVQRDGSMNTNITCFEDGETEDYYLNLSSEEEQEPSFPNITVEKTCSESVSVGDTIECVINVSNEDDYTPSANWTLLDIFNKTFLNFSNANPAPDFINSTHGELEWEFEIPENGTSIFFYANFTAESTGEGILNEAEIETPAEELVDSSTAEITIADDYFDLHGQVKDSAGNNISNANVTMQIEDFSGTDTYIYSTLSDAQGYYNLSGIPALSGAWGYEPVVTAEGYVSKPLPAFPYEEIINVSPLTFYLQNGTQLNITTQNGDTFFYHIKDTKIGYSVEMFFSDNESEGVSQALVSVPKNRDYSIQIMPNGSIPVTYELNNISDYSTNVIDIVFDTTTDWVWVSGYADYMGTAGFTDLTIIPYIFEPGRMVFTEPLYHNMSAWRGQSDQYNPSAGFYNITLPASAMGTELLLFATAYNGTDYVGNFLNITPSIGTDVSEFNFTLQQLAGSEGNITMEEACLVEPCPTIDIETKLSEFYFTNGTDTADNVFAEVELDYVDEGGAIFSWMGDVGDEDNGSFEIPLLYDYIEKMNVFSPDFAPKKVYLSDTDLDTQPVTITLETFSPGGINDEEFTDLAIDLLKNTPLCNVPYPAESCYLSPRENISDFNPFGLVIGGAELSFRMVKTGNNITVHYSNTDLIASGPPDALFDGNASQNDTGSGLAEAFRFGSEGPEIYDEVIIGFPIGQEIDIYNMKSYLGKLYDNQWNVIWDSEVNTVNDIPEEFEDFNTSLFNTTNGMPCSFTDENMTSSFCYIDASKKMMWLKIPHFSGVGTENFEAQADENSVNISCDETYLKAYPNYEEQFDCEFENTGDFDNRNYTLNATNLDGVNYLDINHDDFYFSEVDAGYDENFDIEARDSSIGTYKVEVNVTDNQNSSVFDKLNLTLDVVTAPVITFDSPGNDSLILTNSTELNFTIPSGIACSLTIDEPDFLSDIDFNVFSNGDAELQIRNEDEKTLDIPYYPDSGNIYFGEDSDPWQTFITESGSCTANTELDDCEGAKVLKVESDGTPHEVEISLLYDDTDTIELSDNSYNTNNQTTYTPELFTTINLGSGISIEVNVSEAENKTTFRNLNDYSTNKFVIRGGYNVTLLGTSNAEIKFDTENITLGWFFNGTGIEFNQTLMASQLSEGPIEYTSLNYGSELRGFTEYGSEISFDTDFAEIDYYNGSMPNKGMLNSSLNSLSVSDLSDGNHNISMVCKDYYVDYTFDVDTRTSNVTVEKTIISAQPSPQGQEIEFLINITNAGEQDFSAVEIIDTFDISKINFTTASSAPDKVNYTTGVITWNNISNLNSGSSYLLYVNFSADDSGTATNNAEANAQGEVSNATNSDSVDLYIGDEYESDDSYINANWISVDGTKQKHSFIPANDSDWVKFNGTEGAKYVIRTSELEDGADTWIVLYNSTGSNLTDNDDYLSYGGSSRIEFTASYNDTYYIYIFDFNESHVGGSYDIEVLEIPDVSLTIETHSTNQDVQKGTPFDVIVNATCNGVNCDNLEIYLDPEKKDTKKFSSASSSNNLLDKLDELEEGEYDVVIALNRITEEELEANSAPSFGTKSGEKTEDKIEKRKSAVSTKQNKVLSTLGIEYGSMAAQGASTSKFTLGRKYNVVNAFSGKITKEGIEALAEDSNVEGVYLEETFTASLDVSVPLINADDAWNVQLEGVNMTGEGQTVCVIDTGINYNHADFGGYGYFPNPKVIAGYDFVNEDEDPIDDDGHGSHCAGTVASEDATYTGVAPDAKLAIAKVLDNNGDGITSDIIAGIDWCIYNAEEYNISIISMSLGGNQKNTTTCDSHPMAGAVTYADSLGFTVAVAAGNDGYNDGVSIPACASGAVTVSSSTDADAVSSFSNRHPTLTDVFAPGSSIIATDYTGGHVSSSGTSMATPHVAGAAAILNQYYEMHDGKKLHSEQIKDVLVSTGVTINDGGTDYPRIDVLAALNAPIHKGIISTVVDAKPFYTTSNNPNITSISAGSSKDITWNVTPTGDYGTYEFFAFVSIDGEEEYEIVSNKINITIKDSSFPSLNIESPGEDEIANFSTINFGFNVTDNIDDTLNCSLYINGVLNETNESVQKDTSTQFVKTLQDGDYSWYINCSDEYGNLNISNVSSLRVDTTAPQYSGISVSPESPAEHSAGQDYYFNITFTDNIELASVWIDFNGTTYTNIENDSSTYMFNRTELAVGTYNYTWYANDTAGNLNSTENTYEVQKVTPTINLTLNTIANNITVNVEETVVINGTLIQGDSYMELYEDELLINSGSSPLVNTTSYLSEGTHNITLVYNESENYSRAVLTRWITVIDNVNPNVNSVSPANNTLINETSVYLYFFANDTHSAIDNCSLYVNGSKEQTKTSITEGNNNFSYTAQEGIQTWYVECYDTSSQANSNRTETRVLKVDTTAPVTTITLNPVNETGNNGWYTSAPTITLSCNDNLAGCNKTYYNFTTSPADTEYTAPLTARYGINTFYYYSTDNASNTETEQNITIKLDNIPPAVVENATSNDKVNTSESINVWANFTEDYPLIAKLYVDGNYNSSISNASFVNFTWTAPGSKATENATFYITLEDEAGNINVTENMTVLVNDKTGPVMILYSPENNSLTNLQTLDFTFNVYDNLNLTGSCDLYINETKQTGKTIDFPENGNHSFTSVNLAQDGTFEWYVSCTDTSFVNEHSETWYFQIDTIPPVYSGLSVSPDNNTAYVPGAYYYFNATFTDNVEMDSVWVNFNGQNYSAENASSVYMFNITGLSAGTYTYVWYGNDTARNMNNTEAKTYTITKADPTCSLVLNETGTITYGKQIEASCSCTNPEVTAMLYRNGTDVTSQNGTAITLPAGSWNYVCNSTASQNYTSAENTTSITVNKALSTLTLNSLPSWTETYPTETNVSCTANHNQAVITLERDSTTVSNPEIETLGVNAYVYNCSIPESQNYTANSTSNTLTINQNTSTCSLTITPSETETYGTAVTASCSCTNPEASAQLFRDGSDVTGENGTAITLGANTYNYVCNVSGTQNYTTTENTTTLTINKASDEVNLTLNGVLNSNISIIYPANITAIGNSISGTDSVYKNGTLFTENTPTNLPVGIWEFKVNSTGNENYTANATGLTYYVEVNKTSSAITLTLNGNSENTTVNVGENVAISGTVNVGEGNATIYSGGTPVNSSKPTVTYTYSSLVEVTDHNITLEYAETANYSASTVTYFIDVLDNVAPAVTATSPANDTWSTTSSITFTFTANDVHSAVDNCSLYVDNALKQTNTSLTEGSNKFTQTLTGGTHTWHVKCVDDSSQANLGQSETRTIKVDSQAPTTTLTGVTNGTSYNENKTITLSASDNGISGVNYTSYKIDGGAWTNYSSAIDYGTEGTHTIYYYSVDTAGNVEATKEKTFTIDTTAPAVAIDNPSEGDNISGTVSIDVTSADASNVVFKIDSETLENDQASPFNYSLNTESYSDGSHTLTAIAYDLLQNANSTNITVTIDNTAPTSTITSPSTGTVTNSAVSINGTASDATTAVAQVEVWDGSSWNTATIVGNEWNYTLTLSSDGTYNIKSRATDILGNVETAGAGINVIYDTTPASISSISINPNPSSNATSVSVSASVSDLNGVSVVNATLNGTTVSLANAGGTSYTGTINSPALEGTYNLTITAKDNAGNIAINSAYQLSVNTSAPIIAISPVNESIFTSGTAITINVSNADASYYNTTENATPTYFTGSKTFTASGSGTYVVYAWANSTTGINASQRNVYTIDDTDPTVAIDAVTTPTNTATQNVSGTVTEANLEEIQVNSLTAVVSGSDYWRIVSLSEGANTITVNAYDKAGNSGTNSTSIFLDTQTPSTTASLSGTAGENGWYTSNVNVSFTVNDGAQSSGTTTQYDTGAGFVNGTSVLLSSTDTVVYRTIDNAGNEEANKTTAQIKIDKTNPSVTSVNISEQSPAVNQVVTIRAVITDTNSLSSTQKVTIDGTQYNMVLESGNVYKYDYTPATEKQYSVTINAKDIAGNENSTETITFTAVEQTSESIEFVQDTQNEQDYTSSEDTTIDVRVSSTVTGNLTISESSTQPNLVVNSLGGGIKYVEVDLSDNVKAVLDWLMIRIYYSSGEADGIDEDSLKIAWYNETSDTWINLTAGNPSWVNAAGVNTGSNYVWANVSHLSVYGITGDEEEDGGAPSGGSGGSSSCTDECDSGDSDCLNSGTARICSYNVGTGCWEWDYNYCGEDEQCKNSVCVFMGCSEDWICEPWSSCKNGIQIRNCVDVNGCGTIKSKPAEEKTCETAVEQLEEEFKPEETVKEALEDASEEESEDEGISLWPVISVGIIIALVVILVILGSKGKGNRNFLKKFLKSKSAEKERIDLDETEHEIEELE